MNEPLDPSAVFWDIGGVIVELESIQSGHQDFVDSLLARYESPLSSAEALETWREELGDYFRASEGATYRPAREGYRQAVDSILSEDVAKTEWEQLFSEIHDDHATPESGAVETIQRLSEEEFHLGVLSDVDHEEGQQLLEVFGVRDAFDSFTSSEEVGKTKLDQAMFETALEKAGVAGEEAIMIGDRYSHDMEGGRAAGMTTISYGAEDGPAVDYQIDELPELLGLLRCEPSDS